MFTKYVVGWLQSRSYDRKLEVNSEAQRGILKPFRLRSDLLTAAQIVRYISNPQENF